MIIGRWVREVAIETDDDDDDEDDDDDNDDDDDDDIWLPRRKVWEQVFKNNW